LHTSLDAISSGLSLVGVQITALGTSVNNVDGLAAATHVRAGACVGLVAVERVRACGCAVLAVLYECSPIARGCWLALPLSQTAIESYQTQGQRMKTDLTSLSTSVTSVGVREVSPGLA
jgi:hypothetical protein